MILFINGDCNFAYDEHFNLDEVKVGYRKYRVKLQVRRS